MVANTWAMKASGTGACNRSAMEQTKIRRGRRQRRGSPRVWGWRATPKPGPLVGGRPSAWYFAWPMPASLGGILEQHPEVAHPLVQGRSGPVIGAVGEIGELGGQHGQGVPGVSSTGGAAQEASGNVHPLWGMEGKPGQQRRLARERGALDPAPPLRRSNKGGELSQLLVASNQDRREQLCGFLLCPPLHRLPS
jgi:hypothetical protein